MLWIAKNRNFNLSGRNTRLKCGQIKTTFPESEEGSSKAILQGI